MGFGGFTGWLARSAARHLPPPPAPPPPTDAFRSWFVKAARSCAGLGAFADVSSAHSWLRITVIVSLSWTLCVWRALDGLFTIPGYSFLVWFRAVWSHLFFGTGRAGHRCGGTFHEAATGAARRHTTATHHRTALPPPRLQLRRYPTRSYRACPTTTAATWRTYGG